MLENKFSRKLTTIGFSKLVVDVLWYLLVLTTVNLVFLAIMLALGFRGNSLYASWAAGLLFYGMLISSRIEKQMRRKSWQRTAELFQFRLVNGDPLLGKIVSLEGSLKGRAVKVTTPRLGFSVTATKVELKVANFKGSSLRLRGPFEPGEIKPEMMSKGHFKATKTYLSQDQHPFTFSSKPLHLAMEVDKAWQSRADLDSLATFELEAGTLSYFQPHFVSHPREFRQIFAALSELADIIEDSPFVSLAS